MLVVVETHRLLVDVRLERCVVVRQRRHFEWHGALSFPLLSFRRGYSVLRGRGGYARARSGTKGAHLATLAFNHEEITPRQLKPELLELDGISRESVEANYKLYEGYINKRNEILEKLGSVDLSSANQVYSEVRALKVELSFAIGGIKNHEVYFDHLGGDGGAPDGPI